MSEIERKEPRGDETASAANGPHAPAAPRPAAPRPAVPRPASSAKLPVAAPTSGVAHAQRAPEAERLAAMPTTPLAFKPVDLPIVTATSGPDAPTLPPGPRPAAGALAAAAAASPPSSPAVPTPPDSARDIGSDGQPLVVGRYAVFQQLAAGGMATVHFGRLLGAAGFARTVAIKRLHSHYAKDADFCDMFLDEARIVARIRHPNVVQMVDVVQSSKAGLFLIMEYVHGEPLSKLFRTAKARGERTPIPICATIVADLLHGLHAAHDTKGEDGAFLNVVHRDVSPQNVIVGADGVTRVLDFGIAKAAGRAAVTREGQIKGKLTYMAPEQVRGKVDRRADVFAVGVVLWELLAGRRMHEGLGDGEMLSRVIKGEFSPPSQHNADISPELDALVLKALDASPDARFESARDMARELEQLVPRASPTDVGAWVEGLAREALDARAAVIADMEAASEDLRPGDSMPPAPTEFTLSEAMDIPIDFGTMTQPAFKPIGALAPAPVPREASASAPGPRGSQPSFAEIAAPRAEQDEVRANLVLALVAAIITAVVAGGALLAYSLLTRQAPPPAPDPAPASSVVHAPNPSSALVPAAPPSTGAPGASSAPAQAAPPGASAAVTPRRPATSAPPKPACDPPYTVDDVGHRHYKPECL